MVRSASRSKPRPRRFKWLGECSRWGDDAPLALLGPPTGLTKLAAQSVAVALFSMRSHSASRPRTAIATVSTQDCTYAQYKESGHSLPCEAQTPRVTWSQEPPLIGYERGVGNPPDPNLGGFLNIRRDVIQQGAKRVRVDG